MSDRDDPLARARAIVEAATPGRWEIEREELSRDFSDEEQDLAFPITIGPIQSWEHEVYDDERVEADARHISLMSPRVAVQLLAVAEAARPMLEAVRRDRRAVDLATLRALDGALYALDAALRAHLDGEL